jgi:Smg protein
MNGTVLDILLYVFDRYMFDEAPEVPEREALARHLANAGFGEANVERALDWLADLAGLRQHVPVVLADGEVVAPRPTAALRLYSPQELLRLSAECRGMLLTLEAAEILQPAQRELVIDRLLALDIEDLTQEQVRWVALMVLSSQPGQETACARMETLVFDAESSTTH